MTLRTPIQMPSPNYSSRAGRAIDLIVVHDMEGGFAGSVAWLCSPQSQVSAHLAMSKDGKWAQLVPLGEKAWHACNVNPYSIGIEGAGFVRYGFSPEWFACMGEAVAWLLHEYQLPCRWSPDGEGQGFTTHRALGAKGGGHVDIGLADAEYALDAAVLRYYAATSEHQPWALHGLPNHLTTVTEHDAAPTPTHGGARLADTGIPAAPTLHPPLSTFPAGSTVDLQSRLNAAGAAPKLAVDGYGGPATRSAVAQFQSRNGLYLDGIAGPATKAKLYAMTA